MVRVWTAPTTPVRIIGRYHREQCQRRACGNGAGIKSRKHSRFSMYTFFTLIFPKAKTVRHNGFSRVLLPRPHSDVLKDAGVTLLRELRCLENPSGGFNELSSWGFVFVENKIYAARGVTYYTNQLSRSHNQLLLGDSPCLFSERWR